MSLHLRPQPVLAGARLDLRPFRPGDAPAVQALAGAREIADTTLTIPHPYGDGLAEQWIATHAPAWAAGARASFAVVERASGQLVGAIGLALRPEHARAEMGYWIGLPFWNRGYATEAAALLLGFGFEELGLHRVHARHFARNPQSGRVMRKLGMRHEGRLRQHVRRWGSPEDLEQYGILRDEWRAGPAAGQESRAW
ncbi:MAG TPA: GNAT family N-acetyltransferase [Longimicrobiaceae bacterium]|jgi:RimJ/RimL family protein N-acetyltransferase